MGPKKINMKKSELIKFLLSLGFVQADAERLAANTAEDGTSSIDAAAAETIAQSFKDKQKQIYENDPELIGKIQSAEKGKQLDIITRKLKSTFGLPPELIKDKSVEEIIALAKTEATKGYDKTTQDMQSEIFAANAKLKEYEENIIPTIKSEVDKHKKTFTMQQKLTKMLAEQKLRVPMDVAFPAVENFLNSQFDLDIDDKGEVQIFTKGTKLSPQKADKTGLLSINDIVSEQLNKYQLVEKSNGTPAATTTNVDPIKPGAEGDQKQKPTYVPPHLEAAKAKITQIKTEMDANKAK